MTKSAPIVSSSKTEDGRNIFYIDLPDLPHEEVLRLLNKLVDDIKERNSELEPGN